MSETLSVLIVDDENYVLAGLSAKIPWEKLGLELAGTATNGREALALLEANPIDIVITDILMPEVDGLELIALALELPRRPRFIILSGHGEFEFAKKAMSFGVRHYVLKPTRMAEIEVALSELSQEIESLAADSDIGPVDSDLLRDTLVRALLFGRRLEAREDELIRTLGVDLDTSAAMIFGIDLGEPVSPQLARSAQIIAERALAGYPVPGSIVNGSCVILLVIASAIPDSIENLPVELRKLGTLRRSIRSTEPVLLGELAQRYASIAARLAASFYTPAEEVSVVGKIDAGAESAERGAFDGALGALQDELRTGESALSLRLDDVIAQAAAERVDPAMLTARLCEMLGEVARAVGGPDLEQTLERIDRIRLARDADQLRAIAVPLIESIARLALQLQQTPHLRTVNAVKESVRKRYGEHGLSLKKIATSDVYANVDYLGRVFRSVTGRGFSDYLRATRMEKAAELLRAFPQLPVHEIAERVGFGENSQYFASSFKQHFAMTPSEYRSARERG